MGNSSDRVELPPDMMDNLVENTHFKKNEIRQIYRKFMKESPDGNLTKNQFVNLYKSRATQENVDIIASHMFRAFDLNNSYTVDFTEFLLCLSITTRGSMKEQIRWIFRLYDINGDGLLNISEILEILRSANLENEYADTVTELFQRMDTNHDGVLTMDEFVNQSMDDFTFVKVLGRTKNEKPIRSVSQTSPPIKTRNISKIEMSPTTTTTIRNGRSPSRSENSPSINKLNIKTDTNTIIHENGAVDTYY